jgi:hypothetical protein
MTHARVRLRWLSAADIRSGPPMAHIWCHIRCHPRPATSSQLAGDAVMNTEHKFADTNRHLVEVPDTFAVARWPRDADVATIARCILGTLKYEPHGADTTPLRRALESVIDHEQRASSTERAR